VQAYQQPDDTELSGQVFPECPEFCTFEKDPIVARSLSLARIRWVWRCSVTAFDVFSLEIGGVGLVAFVRNNGEDVDLITEEALAFLIHAQPQTPYRVEVRYCGVSSNERSRCEAHENRELSVAVNG
jgi:hypothetical protein